MQQSHVQHKMQQSIRRGETGFQKITLSLKEYENSKVNAFEISLNGKMYDVKSVTISGDIAELLVINDREEENILKEIKAFLTMNDHKANTIPPQLKVILSLNYLLPEVKQLFFIPSLSAYSFYFSGLHFSSVTAEVSVPPPELM